VKRVIHLLLIVAVVSGVSLSIYTVLKIVLDDDTFLDVFVSRSSYCKFNLFNWQYDCFIWAIMHMMKKKRNHNCISFVSMKVKKDVCCAMFIYDILCLDMTPNALEILAKLRMLINNDGSAEIPSSLVPPTSPPPSASLVEDDPDKSSASPLIEEIPPVQPLPATPTPSPQPASLQPPSLPESLQTLTPVKEVMTLYLLLF
jgi:hypothetical protein